MIKNLFVCHGNICRSPMAELVMKDMVEKSGKISCFEIASAATSSEELGNPVYPPAARMLRSHGIDPSGKRAVRMTKRDYDYYDYLICMDSWNVRNVLRITGGDPDRKISLLMDYTVRPGDVADPWYTGDFNSTWRDVTEGCEGLLNRLEKAEE